MRTFADRLRLSWLLTSALSLTMACSNSGSSASTGTIEMRPTGGSTSGGSAGNSLGQSCDSDSSCGDDLTCFTSIPGGYCSTTCSGSADCPTGGSCATPISGEQICIVSCQPASGCGRAGYVCDPYCSVCVPGG